MRITTQRRALLLVLEELDQLAPLPHGIHGLDAARGRGRNLRYRVAAYHDGEPVGLPYGEEFSDLGCLWRTLQFALTVARRLHQPPLPVPGP